MFLQRLYRAAADKWLMWQAGYGPCQWDAAMSITIQKLIKEFLAFLSDMTSIVANIGIMMAAFNGKANKLHFAPCWWWEANFWKVFPLSNLQTVSSMYLLSCLLCDQRKWSKNRKSEVHHSQEAVIVHQLWFWPLLIVIPSNFAQFGSNAITHRVKCDENRKGKQTEWRLTPKIGWSFFYDFPK